MRGIITYLCIFSMCCSTALSLPKILLISSDLPEYNAGVLRVLNATGQFSSIDIYDASQAAPPTLSYLQNYNAIFTWANSDYADPVGYGDLFASYVEAGGGVVDALFELYYSKNLQGAWKDYRLITANKQSFQKTDYSILVPSHPLVEGVTNTSFVDSVTPRRGSDANVTTGSTVIAKFSSGEILIATKDFDPTGMGKRRVSVNIYPCPYPEYVAGWVEGADVIFANALRYVSCNNLKSTITTCSPPLSVTLQAPDCGATVPDFTQSIVADEDCGQISQSPEAGTILNSGKHNVILTLSFLNGTVSDTCVTTFDVKDETIPTISCPAPMTLTTEPENCYPVIPDLESQIEAQDVCGTLTLKNSTTMVGLGVYVLTVRATDDSQNYAECNTTITIQDDYPPTIACPDNITIVGTDATSTITPDLSNKITSTDNCGYNVSQVPAIGSLLDVGSHNVTFTSTDIGGNSVECNTVLIVLANDNPPDEQISSGMKSLGIPVCSLHALFFYFFFRVIN